VPVRFDKQLRCFYEEGHLAPQGRTRRHPGWHVLPEAYRGRPAWGVKGHRAAVLAGEVVVVRVGNLFGDPHLGKDVVLRRETVVMVRISSIQIIMKQINSTVVAIMRVSVPQRL